MFKMFFSLFFLFFAYSSHANDMSVYKWVDKDNVVHYSQDQPTNKNFERVTIEVAYKPSSKITMIDNDLLNELEKQKQQKQLAAQAEERDKMIESNCKSAQVNIKILAGFTKISVTDPSGEKRILTPEEKAEQLLLTQKNIDIFCNVED